jgi:hypothetical protein
MTGRIVLVIALALVAMLIPAMLVTRWQSSAVRRLAEQEAEEAGREPEVATAAEADEEYCTPQLRQILRRVLTSCGLIGGSGRGCQPVEARSVATMSGDDFNALFLPMQQRGGIVQFEQAARPGSSIASSRIGAARRTSSSSRAPRPRAPWRRTASSRASVPRS